MDTDGITMTDDRELIMPFVTVRSNGGPHDDSAYCAGFEMGMLDVHLSAITPWATESLWTIRSENRPQADLIAMRYGYRLSVCSETDGWSNIVIYRKTKCDDDDDSP